MACGILLITHPGVAATMFATLSDKGINIEMITTSEIKISALIPRDRAVEGLRAVHEAFGAHRAARGDDTQRDIAADQHDERARVKREINLRLGSTLVEEKSYQDYGSGSGA